MSIRLPQFEDGFSSMFTACAEVAVKDKKLAELLTKKQEMIAAYESSRGPALFRVMVRNEPGNFVHVDCALEQHFLPQEVPKPNKKVDRLEAFLDPFLGLTAEIGLVGTFRVPLRTLPPRGIIRILSEEQKTAGVSIRLTEGTFEFAGCPVSRIQWSIEAEAGIVSAIVFAAKEGVLGESYLADSTKWLTEQFNVIVVGEAGHAAQRYKPES